MCTFQHDAAQCVLRSGCGYGCGCGGCGGWGCGGCGCSGCPLGCQRLSVLHAVLLRQAAAGRSRGSGGGRSGGGAEQARPLPLQQRAEPDTRDRDPVTAWHRVRTVSACWTRQTQHTHAEVEGWREGSLSESVDRKYEQTRAKMRELRLQTAQPPCRRGYVNV
ncbi:hypothetical protein B484DRAFT_187869 [Ochromonadaceae sp. CCMP2298]|nr:hypothetical protein B484DRAFT_187869 [Ochromonadaceae sp. CCMP2298]